MAERRIIVCSSEERGNNEATDEYYLHFFRAGSGFKLGKSKVRAEVKKILKFWLDLGGRFPLRRDQPPFQRRTPEHQGLPIWARREFTSTDPRCMIICRN